MKGFIPYVESYPKPNSHGSHLMTYLLVKVALENGIILVCLLPNTLHALQPLDVGVFNPVKTAWGKILTEHHRLTRRGCDKESLPSLLNKLWAQLDLIYFQLDLICSQLNLLCYKLYMFSA